MVWVIIAIVIIVLVVEWTSHWFGIFAGGFYKNIYGILAILFGFISAFYFWISSKSFQDYKAKDKIMKLFDNNFSNKSELPDKSVIDLSHTNLQGLVSELQSALTSPKPLIFKGWGNRRLKLDVERVMLMNDYIRAIIDTGQAFIRLNVDAIVSYEKVQALAKTEINELKQKVSNSEFNLKILDDKYESIITKIRTETEIVKFDLEKMKYSFKMEKEEHEMSMKEREHNLKIREMELGQKIKESNQQIRENELDSQNRINMTEVHMYIEKLKADNESKFNKSFITLYNKMSKELNLENITPSQVLVLISLFSKNPAANYEDVDAKRALFNETLKKMKQDTAYRKAEARDKRLDNEVKVYKMRKENVNLDIDSNG